MPAHETSAYNRPGRLAQWRRVPRPSRLGILLLLALLVPAGVVAVVGVASLRSEAVAREHLLNETYRQVAEIAAAQLDNRIAALEAEVAAAFAEPEASLSPEALIGTLRELQDARPWLRPALIIRSNGTLVYPPTSPAGLVWGNAAADGADSEFRRVFDAAEAAELGGGDLGNAVELYAEAVELAPDASPRVRALNGLARCELKRERYLDAIVAYDALIGAAGDVSPERASLALIAHRQRAAAAHELDDSALAIRASLDLYAFLIHNGPVLDQDLAAFYRRDVESWLEEVSSASDDGFGARLEQLRRADRAARAIDARRAALRAALQAVSLPGGGITGAPFPVAATSPADGLAFGSGAIVVTPIAGTTGSRGILLAHEWRQEHVEAVLEDLLSEPGPWDEASVALASPEGSPAETLAVAAAAAPLATPTIPADATLTASVIELLPAWHVVAFPADGSVSALVDRYVRGYGLTLGLALAAIVAAVALGSRSVSRELSLVRLRSQFVSSVSHELRTPLSLIRMFTESLEEGWIDEAERAATYGKIRRETERLTGLIDNVLDFSRLESGTRTLDVEDIDIDELIADTAQRFAPEFEAADIDCRIETDVPVRVRAEREAIHRVLVNLLSNAVKYIGDGERRITVASCANGSRAGFRVSDSGIGMTPADTERIFERYFRADDERARSVAGSGIGLTVSKGIVDEHGGSLEVRSALGEGSEFTVWLPAVEGGGA